MREIFHFRNNAEKKSGRLVPDLFLFYKKHLSKSKQVVSTLVLVRPPLENAIKKHLFVSVDP